VKKAKDVAANLVREADQMLSLDPNPTEALYKWINQTIGISADAPQDLSAAAPEVRPGAERRPLLHFPQGGEQRAVVPASDRGTLRASGNRSAPCDHGFSASAWSEFAARSGVSRSSPFG